MRQRERHEWGDFHLPSAERAYHSIAFHSLWADPLLMCIWILWLLFDLGVLNLIITHCDTNRSWCYIITIIIIMIEIPSHNNYEVTNMKSNSRRTHAINIKKYKPHAHLPTCSSAHLPCGRWVQLKRGNWQRQRQGQWQGLVERGHRGQGAAE